MPVFGINECKNGWRTTEAKVWGNFQNTAWLSKLLYSGMKYRIWKKVPDFAWTLFLPHGLEIELIFAPHAAVFEIQANFQNSIFGHKIWNLKTGPKVAYVLLSTPGVEIKLIFALWTAVFDISVNFQNCLIWAWKLESEDRSQNCICNLFIPHGIKIKLIFLCGDRFRDTGRF